MRPATLILPAPSSATHSTSTSRQTIPGLLLLRVFSCLAIVAVHGPTDNTLGKGFFWLALDQLVRFGTPMMVFLSVLIMYQGYRPETFSVRSFALNRFRYIVLPYLFVTGLLIYPTIRDGGGVDLWGQLLTGNGSHLYFIPLILQAYALFALLHYLPRQIDWQRLFPFTVLLAVGISSLCVAFSIPVRQWMWMLPYWLPFYAMGAALGTNPTLAQRWKGTWGWPHMALMAGLALAVIFQPFIFSLQESVRYDILTSSRSPIVVLYAAMAIVLSYSQVDRLLPFILKHPLVRTLVNGVSSASFGIYLIHPLLIQYLNRHLPGFTNWWPPLSLTLVVLLSWGIVTGVQSLPGGSYLLGRKSRKLLA